MVFFYAFWLVLRRFLVLEEENLNEAYVSCSDYSLSVSGFNGNTPNFNEAEFVSAIARIIFNPPMEYVQKYCFTYDIDEYLRLEEENHKLLKEKALIDSYRIHKEAEAIFKEGRYLTYEEKMNLYPLKKNRFFRSKGWTNYFELLHKIDVNHSTMIQIENNENRRIRTGKCFITFKDLYSTFNKMHNLYSQNMNQVPGINF